MHLEAASLSTNVSYARLTTNMAYGLERQSVTGSTYNSSLDLRSLKQTRNGVRSLSHRALLGLVLGTSKVVARLNRETSIGGVQSLLGVDKDVVLNKQLRALASVDTIGNAIIVVVEEVAGAEAERRAARVEVLEVIVGIGNGQVALIFGAVGVGVADQRCLPVVVQEGVGYGNEVSSVGNIQKTIIVVLVVVAVR